MGEASTKLRDACLRPVAIIALGVILQSCDAGPQGSLAQPEKFAEVYVALLIASAGDTLLPAQSDSIFAAHGCNRVQFEAAVKHYSTKAERWQPVFAAVVERLKTELEAENKNALQDSSSSVPSQP